MFMFRHLGSVLAKDVARSEIGNIRYVEAKARISLIYTCS